MIVGVALLAIEVFVTPGFGVMGISGIVCIVLLIALSTTGIPWSASGLTEYWLAPMVYTVFGTLTGTVALFPLMLKLLPHIPYINQAILDPHVDATQGSSMLDQETDSLAAAVSIGAVGIASTDLRPAGVATIGGERLDVTTDGRYVERGTPIEVKSRNHGKIVVTPQA